MVKERNAQDHLAQSCQQQRLDVNKQLQFLEKVISTSYKPATKHGADHAMGNKNGRCTRQKVGKVRWSDQ